MAVVICCLACCLSFPPPECLTRNNIIHIVSSAVQVTKGQVLAYLFITKGMPKEDVREILGVPSIEYSACGHTTYLYLDYHLQLWFENDCPKRKVVQEWQGKKETYIEWADNPSHPRYKDRLTKYCIHLRL
jgi:outer membrane protein assembly factor BamE (lipoprotein component of BamABCDE complex)